MSVCVVEIELIQSVRKMKGGAGSLGRGENITRHQQKFLDLPATTSHNMMFVSLIELYACLLQKEAHVLQGILATSLRIHN